MDLKQYPLESLIFIDVLTDSGLQFSTKSDLSESRERDCYIDLKNIFEAGKDIEFSDLDKRNNNLVAKKFNKEKYSFSYYIPFLGLSKIQKLNNDLQIIQFGTVSDKNQLNFVLNINFIPFIRKIKGSIKIKDSDFKLYDNQYCSLLLDDRWNKTETNEVEEYHFSVYTKRDAHMGFADYEYIKERKEDFFSNQRFTLNILRLAVDPNSIKFTKFDENRILVNYQSADILSQEGMTQNVMAEIKENNEWRSVGISSYFGFYELNKDYFEKIYKSVIFKW